VIHHKTTRVKHHKTIEERDDHVVKGYWVKSGINISATIIESAEYYIKPSRNEMKRLDHVVKGYWVKSGINISATIIESAEYYIKPSRNEMKTLNTNCIFIHTTNRKWPTRYKNLFCWQAVENITPRQFHKVYTHDPN
jgi:hypothetical protein